MSMDLDTAVASRVVKATSVAAHAVTTCDEALLHATGGEAADEEAGLRHRSAAPTAPQQALAAAAGCAADVAAAAASREANAFADSCVAACVDAATLTLAAGEAGARCVLARDDATTAALVTQQILIWPFFVSKLALIGRRAPIWPDLASKLAHCKAARESAEGHKKACKDAVKASLAARKAAVRCAATSRRAISAASVAREAASCCDAAGGDEAAAAADAAAAAAGLADAAAVKAREAAASCDAALANSSIGDADKDDFLDKMRGWLMTVATLFVGISFQAIAHPPDGMSWDHCGRSWSSKDWKKATSGAPRPSRACWYLYANTATMAVALTLLVVLLTMNKATSRITLLYIQILLASLAFMVAVSFITSISGDQLLRRYILFSFGSYAILTILFVVNTGIASFKGQF